MEYTREERQEGSEGKREGWLGRFELQSSANDNSAENSRAAVFLREEGTEKRSGVEPARRLAWRVLPRETSTALTAVRRW